MSNVEEYTKNFKFMIPEFNVATWHTEIKENFKAIDALIANFVQSQQYKGAWKQVTSYIINDLVYINDEDSDYYGFLMRVKVNHITTGDDFDTFLANNPTYYEVQGEMGAQIAALRAQDWAEKIDGMVVINEVPIDYSSKAYAIGGVGTETNNSKYFKEQAELACDTILQDPGFIAVSADLVGDENIKTVADNIQNVNNVGNNILSILSVYNNLSDINVCSSNISAILDAPTQAINAQNSATSAAQSAQLAQEAALSITSFDLFDHKWSDHLLNDQNWLRADTFSWQNGTVYTEAYNHLVADLGTVEENWYAWVADTGTDEEIIIFTKSETVSVGDNVYNYDRDTIIGTVERYDTDSQKMYNTAFNYGFWKHSIEDIEQSDISSSGAIRQTETIGSYTITYWLATDGHKICLPDQETTAANIYTESGVAWYYILDTTNQRFKLPRTKYGFTGLRDTVGKYVPESLPSIKSTNWGVTWGSGQMPSVYWEDPYSNDYPVQQRATQMYLYFYVGQFSQSATEQTAGLNSELFNAKLDLNAGNATSTTVNNLISNADNTAKTTIVSWGMPDYSSAVSFGSSIQTPYDCMIECGITSAHNSGWVSIDGVSRQLGNGRDDSHDMWYTAYVPKGITIQSSGCNVSRYYKLKGV